MTFKCTRQKYVLLCAIHANVIKHLWVGVKKYKEGGYGLLHVY